MAQVWLSRGGAQGEYEEFLVENGFTGGGWRSIPDLTPCAEYQQIFEAVQGANPESKMRAIGNWAGQLWILRVSMNIGDFVLMPRKGQAAVAVGRITGDYQYLGANKIGFRHVRPVEWLKTEVPKTNFGADIQRTFGALMTMCEIRRSEIEARTTAVSLGQVDPLMDSPDEIEGPGNSVSPVEVEVESNVANDAQLSIQELIRHRFPGHELSNLVAAVLEANGYQTEVSPPGPDGGVDVLAARGDLGFEGPRIAVQVKNTISAQGVPQINELVGAKTAFGADRALYVSWSGFTSQATSLARSNWFEIRLWNADVLVEQVTAVYDLLDAEIRAKLPLRQVWISAVEEAE
jgi:restriction system protein